MQTLALTFLESPDIVLVESCVYSALQADIDLPAFKALIDRGAELGLWVKTVTHQLTIGPELEMPRKAPHGAKLPFNYIKL